LGGTERAFFRDRSKGKFSEQEERIRGNIENMLDQFMHEYSWTIPVVASHTYYQLKKLSAAIAERKYLWNKTLANIVRAAQNTDRADFERFVNSLKPQDAGTETAVLPGVSGFSYQKEI
jgi:hypothetical protein